MSAALDTGTVLEGRFEVVRQVASGGMGQVYLAEDREAGGPVAVKTLTALDEPSRARFAREAALLARVQHPSLVRYVSHGATADGGCWLAMEWLDGLDLRARLGPRGEAVTLAGTRVGGGSSAPVSPRGLGVAETVHLGRRLAAGLGALHVEGIVHRDVKPANVFLPGGDLARAKLVDLGTARVALDEASVTRTGLLIGTPMYMSPEQARAESDVDAAADVWGLGCVLYECLAGGAPFRGGQLVAILARVLFDTVVPLGVVRADVPAPLADLVHQMLQKDRQARPSAAEVLRALEAVELAAPSASRQSTPVGAAPREAAVTGDERRVRCILVARGPGGVEDARATLHDSMVRGGVSTERLAEGSLVITVPGTLPPTDQAVRLARAALLLRERAPQHALSIAMGRASGGETITAGEIVERAALVLRRTDPGTIHVDALCRTLLLGRFDLDETADGALLLRAKEREATRTLLGKPTRTVGRRRELSMLRASYEDCVEGERPRAVLVTGHAGMGKSRLRYELVRALDGDDAPPRWIEAQADALSAGAPFGLLAPALRRAAGLSDPGATAAKRAAVRALVADVGASPRAARFLGELMGVPFEDGEDDALRAGRGDPMLLGESMLAAFVEWTGCAARQRPLVFLLEDLHWGDRPSVRYLDAALRAHADLPIFVVALARPEVHAQFPGLFADHGLEEIKLDALARKASEELVRQALPHVDDAQVAALVERAGGHALYLEELIRAVSEGAGDRLPDSVLGMVQSRLDSLGAEAKRVLRAGSVFGEVFWADGVRALLHSDDPTLDIDEWLTQLVAREVVTSRTSERFGQAREYRFRHALVRDGAYETLPEEHRALCHRLVGEWLEAQGETDGATLATHFARGQRPGRASRWYRRAAEQALEGNDLEGASEALDRALATAEGPDERGALLALRATTRYWQSAYEDTRVAGLAALDSLPPGSADWFTALGFTLVATARLADWPGFDEVFARGRVAQASHGAAASQIVALCRGTFQLLFSGRFTEADATLQLVDGLAAAAGDLDPLTRAQHRHVTGVRAAMVGNVAGFLPPLEEAVDYFQRAGDTRNALLERTTLGWCYAEVGDTERAISTLRANLELCRAARAPQAITYAKVNLGYALSLGTDTLAEAEGVLRDAIAECEAVQNARLEGWARGHLASVLRTRADHAAERAEATLAVARLAGSPGLRAWTTALLARAELACGRPQEALEQAERAMAALVTLGGMLQGESLPPLALAEALHVMGHTERAREAAQGALERVMTRAQRFQDATQREGFLARAENAATAALAAQLQGPLGA